MDDDDPDPFVRWSDLSRVAVIWLIIFIFVAVFWAGKKAKGGDLGAGSTLEFRRCGWHCGAQPAAVCDPDVPVFFG